MKTIADQIAETIAQAEASAAGRLCGGAYAEINGHRLTVSVSAVDGVTTSRNRHFRTTFLVDAKRAKRADLEALLA